MMAAPVATCRPAACIFFRTTGYVFLMNESDDSDGGRFHFNSATGLGLLGLGMSGLIMRRRAACGTPHSPTV